MDKTSFFCVESLNTSITENHIAADGIEPLHDLCDASCIVLDIAVLLVS